VHPNLPALILGIVLILGGALSIVFSERFARWQKAIGAYASNFARGRAISFGAVVIGIGMICTAASIWG